jgi:Spy/CpxP family protein refolding chaperone
VAGVALAGWAYSQTAASSRPCHEGKFVERMTEKLNLTADQQTQVKGILEQAKTDAGSAPDKQAKHVIFKAAFDKIKTDVLTVQQRTEWQQMKTHWRHGHHGKMMGYRALGLTPDQQSQVHAIMQQAKTDAASAADGQAKHDIWKAAKEKINTTVLTQAQRDQLAQMRTECKRHHAPASEPAATGQ